MNLYAYVGNNPESLFDPDGHRHPPAAVSTEEVPTGRCDWLTCTRIKKTVVAGKGQSWSLYWQAEASVSFLKGELKGVADVTITPLVQTIEHPVDTAVGIASAVAHPVQTAENALSGAKATLGQLLQGNPRATGQVVGFVAVAAYGARNVRLRLYENSGGGGLNILNTPTEGSRIGLDVQGIPEAGGGVRPHVDVTIKKPGVPSGPGSNLVNIRHWPWN